MALIFPNSPTIGQRHTQDGATFEWSGFGWQRVTSINTIIGPQGEIGPVGPVGPAGGSGDTATEILAKLITVDGVGSGLDADTLQGFSPEDFESSNTAIQLHIADNNNPHGVSKSHLGLSNVDNTSDASKPVSTAQQNALNLKANLISPILVTPNLGTPSVLIGTNISGTANFLNSGSATTLETPRTINGVSFDGSANITINAVDSTPRIASSLIGANDGVASLNSSGKVPLSQLPEAFDDVLSFSGIGSFPAIGEVGKLYIALDTNKLYHWNSVSYVFVTSGAVDSVAGRTGAVVLTKSDVGLSNVDNTSDINKPISTAQQTALNTKINSVEGSASHLNISDHIHLAPFTQPAFLEGSMWYDAEKQAMSYYTDIAGSSLQIGFENWVRVRNASGEDLLEGTVVKITGAIGQTPTITKAIATTDNHNNVIGVLTSNIAKNTVGLVTTFGIIHDYNTSGWAEGTILYLSHSVPGLLSSFHPVAPNFATAIAMVVYQHVNKGKLFIRPVAAGIIDREVTLDTSQFTKILGSTSSPLNEAMKTLDQHTHFFRTSVIATTQVNLSLNSTIFQFINPNGANRVVLLPSVTALDKSVGFTIYNSGVDGFSLTIRNYNNVQIGQIIPNGSSTHVVWDGTVWKPITEPYSPFSHMGTGGTSHALATQSISGFLSATDKTKLDGIATGAQVNTVTSVASKTGSVILIKSDVGLDNVDNTSDLLKPISTAQQSALDLKANIASPTFTGTVSGITKAMVGLGSVDNTSDSLKPISTAQQSALDLKANIASPTFTGTVSGITKTMVGLGNADNTSDSLKPISTAQQSALDLKANIANPTFTGNVSGLGVSTGISFNSITALSNTLPVVVGTAAIGTSTTVARSDHAHASPTIGSIGGQPLDADLTAISSLTGTGLARRTASDTWTVGSQVSLSTEVTGTLAVANGGTGVTSATGTGSVVRNTSPTLTGSLTVSGSASTPLTLHRDSLANSNILFSNTSFSTYFGLGTANGELRVGVSSDLTSSGIVYHSQNLTNLNQLSNGPGYLIQSDTAVINGAWSFTQNVAGITPTMSSHFATKEYVDTTSSGLNVIDAVLVATSAQITLSGIQTIDGVLLTALDRVLVKNQSLAYENGVYVVSAGGWTRATDFDETPQNEVKTSTYIFVESGATLGSTGWVVSTPSPIIVGTSDILFTQFTGAAQLNGGDGLVKTGTTFDIVTASSSRIVVNPNSIDLATTGVSPSTYKSVAVDSYGRITSGSNPTTLSGYGITDAAPFSHIGTGGVSHADAISGVASGFLSATDKSKLDGIADGASVTSVSGTGAVSGLTLTGTVTSSGSLTLGGTIEQLNQNTTGTAAGLSQTLAVSSGGTGVTTSTGSGNVVLSASPTFTGTVSGITKAMVGLGNVDNTSDLLKPISTAQQNALDLKANIASPTFTGNVSASSFNLITTLAATLPEPLGVPTIGLSTTVARADHIHELPSLATLGAQPSGTYATGTGSATGVNTGDNSPNSLYSSIVSNATHTGDVTGSTALTIVAGAVTLSKMANVATGTIFYRKTAATGVPEVQTLATLKTDLGLTGTNSGDNPGVTSVTGTGTVSGLTLSGSITSTGSLTLGGTIEQLNQNTTGSAASLTTSRLIGGTLFNGTDDIAPVFINSLGIQTVPVARVALNPGLSTYRHSASGGPTSTGEVVSFGSNTNSGGHAEIAVSWNGSPSMHIRSLRDVTDNWTTWVPILSSLNFNTYAPTLTGTGASGSWGISVTGNAGTVTTNANLTGDVTSVGNTTSLSASIVTGKLITGYVSGSGTLAATDTILQAINKLNGNTSLKANIASPTFTGTVSGITAAMVGALSITETIDGGSY